MSVLPLSLTSVTPDPEEVCEGMNMPPEKISARHRGWFQEAIEAFLLLAEPVGVIEDVSLEDFSQILRGEGLNEPDPLIHTVYPHSSALVLFAATVGSKVCELIPEWMQSDKEVQALFLDFIASRAAENCCDAICEQILSTYKTESVVPPHTAILAYSPGYCGWHISGQKQLFTHLKPESIGISLSEDYLMSPMKSVSGVLVLGKKEIFLDDMVYPYCRACGHPTCKERRKTMSAWIY